ncbi:MAG TPA: hypothetical protein VIZ18_19580 [Ktedonobacteraceae bacterium]
MQKVFRWPTLIVLAVLLLAALIPTVISISHATYARASGNATITLSAPTGQPGATIAVSGQGFAASTAVSLYLGDTSGPLLGTATTDGSGNLPSTTFTIPDQRGGDYDVDAVVQGTVIASAILSIEPEFTLSNTVLYPGETITVNGKGFAGEIFFYFDSTTSYFYGLPSNGNGDLIAQQLILPRSNVLQGAHNIIAQSSYYGVTLSSQLPVTLLPHLIQMYGQPGLNTRLTGAAFTASEPVSIYWGTSSGQLLGTSTTDANGNLSFSFTAPSGLTDGVYPVTVVRPTTQKPRVISTIFHVKPVTMNSTPGIRINQSSLHVKVTGFLSNDQITLSWSANGGQTIGTMYANLSGGATGTFYVPSAPVGSYTLTASDSAGLKISNSLNIGPGISSFSGDPGSTVNVNGGGFSANETLNVYFQTPNNGVVTATTDATGAFSVSLTLPSSYSPTQKYYIHAVSTSGNDHALTQFKFIPPTFSACDFSCSDAYYGQSIYFRGSDFAVNEMVNIIWNYGQPGQFTIAAVQNQAFNGFMANETVPSTLNQSTLVVAAIGQTSHLILMTTLSVDASINDTPFSGKVGATIAVNGGNFNAGDVITLTLSGATVATTTGKSDGTFSTTFKVPYVSGAGNLTLMATDAVTNASATVPFYYTPTLTVNPSIVKNGDHIVVTGQHFDAANPFVNVSVGNGSNSTGYYPTVNANGAFTLTVTINGLQSGTAYVSAYDIRSSLVVSTAFVVQ